LDSESLLGISEDLSAVNVCSCSKDCPPARCASAANAVSRDVDWEPKLFLSTMSYKLYSLIIISISIIKIFIVFSINFLV
jgi:hypothetical protein